MFITTGILEQKPRYHWDYSSGFNTGANTWLRNSNTFVPHNGYIDEDNKIYLFYSYTSYKGTTLYYIIRLNADGTIDTTFNTGVGFDSPSYNIARDSSGDLYISGSFSKYKNSAVAARVVKLNRNGDLDATFNTNAGTGFNNITWDAHCDRNNSIYISGRYTTFNGSGTNAKYLVKLNSDGTKDSTFSQGSGFNFYVKEIRTDANNDLYVSGEFSNYNGVEANRIIKLNGVTGAKDTSFDNSTGFNNQVEGMTVMPNGKIACVGSFTTYKGAASDYFAVLNPDGSKDTNYGVLNGRTTAIAADNENRLYAAGAFTTYAGTSALNFVRINSDGSIDNTCKGIATGDNQYFKLLAIDWNGDIILGGSLSKYNNTTVYGIAKINRNNGLLMSI